MARHRQHRPEAARCARRGVPLLLLFRVRRSGRVQVVLDVGGAEGPMAGGLLRCVSVLSPNETELHRMTGAATGTRAEVVLAARALQQQGAHDVLVKLGSKGSLLVAGTLPPPPHLTRYPCSHCIPTHANPCGAAGVWMECARGRCGHPGTPMHTGAV